MKIKDHNKNMNRPLPQSNQYTYRLYNSPEQILEKKDKSKIEENIEGNKINFFLLEHVAQENCKKNAEGNK